MSVISRRLVRVLFLPGHLIVFSGVTLHGFYHNQVSVYIYIYIYTHTRRCIHAYIHKYMQSCVLMSMYMSACVYTTITYMYIYIYISVCVCVCVHVCTPYIYIYMYTCMHAYVCWWMFGSLCMNGFSHRETVQNNSGYRMFLCRSLHVCSQHPLVVLACAFYTLSNCSLKPPGSVPSWSWVLGFSH